MITFNGIPTNLRTPGTFVEVDNSLALQGLLPWYQKVLMIGQKNVTNISDTSINDVGTATADEVIFVPSTEQAKTMFGHGSMLARMTEKFKYLNPYLELWAIPIGDGTTAAQTDMVTITCPGASGVADSAGAMFLYLGGREVRVSIEAGDSPTVIGNAAKAAINVDYDLPVYCTDNLSGVLKLKAKHKGIYCNDVDVRVNYFPGQELPANVVVTTAANWTGGTVGAGNPSIANAIAAMGDDQFDYVICGLNDDTALGLLEDELDRRYGPLIQQQSIGFSAIKKTYGSGSPTLEGWCENGSHNCPHLSMFGYEDAPSPTEELAAAYGAVASYNLNADPARPLQTLEAKGVYPPSEGSSGRFTQTERNVLLWNGITTWTVNANGNIMLDRAITTYRKNVYGVPDPSYLDVNTMATIMYARYQLRSRLAQKYARFKLANDTTVVPPGQMVVRPKDVKADIIAWARLMETVGIMENIDIFANELVVERNSTDPNRLDILLPTDWINQLRIIAVKNQFKL